VTASGTLWPDAPNGQTDNDDRNKHKPRRSVDHHGR
jgi:hypothetical protein